MDCSREIAWLMWGSIDLLVMGRWRGGGIIIIIRGVVWVVPRGMEMRNELAVLATAPREARVDGVQRKLVMKEWAWRDGRVMVLLLSNSNSSRGYFS
jgi:hypothetical protein